MENKKANFKRISSNRVDKILVLLKQMTNLCNSSFYEYTEEEIENIFELLNNELSKTKSILLNNINKKKGKFTL